MAGNLSFTFLPSFCLFHFRLDNSDFQHLCKTQLHFGLHFSKFLNLKLVLSFLQIFRLGISDMNLSFRTLQVFWADKLRFYCDSLSPERQFQVTKTFFLELRDAYFFVKTLFTDNPNKLLLQKLILKCVVLFQSFPKKESLTQATLTKPVFVIGKP